jgi:hypothetical protein
MRENWRNFCRKMAACVLDLFLMLYSEKYVWHTRSFIFNFDVYFQVLLMRLTRVDKTWMALFKAVLFQHEQT